jgi:hypothetical protein
MHILRNTILIIIACLLIIYALLWLASIKKYPVEYGISFDKNHATYLGFDWQKVYTAMLDDLKPKYIRLSANWDEIEKVSGSFDTTWLDWQMKEAGKRGVKVALVVGQKTPRWPECHVPEWASQLSVVSYKLSVKEYMKYVVERYKDNPALDIWQVENEPFIKFKFGDCKLFDEDLVTEEVNLVKSLDDKHKTMLTDSGEMGFWFSASRLSDIFGTTLYRTVKTPGGFVWSYNWLPAGMYKLKARLWSKGYENFFVSELQAEPWFNGAHPNDVDVSEQEMTMSVKRLQKNINYTSHVGASRVYLWGVEWWYWMKESNGDVKYWDLVKQKIRQ